MIRPRKLGGGLRPPSEPPPRNRLRRRSRRSKRNAHRVRYFSWPCGVYSPRDARHGNMEKSTALARRGASPPFRTSPPEPVAPAKPALEAERPPGAVFLVAMWRLLSTRRASREHGEVHGLSSEGGFAPLPNLPPGTGCAGEAGARSGTPTGCRISRGHVAFTLHATRVTGTWRSPRP